MNRLLISVIGFLSLSVVAVAMAIYAMVARPQAAGVTLSVVGGASACNEYADVSCVNGGESTALAWRRLVYLADTKRMESKKRRRRY